MNKDNAKRFADYNRKNNIGNNFKEIKKMTLHRNMLLYRAVQFLCLCYIAITSIFCIIWAGNYPMEDCIQYVLSNTNIQDFTNKFTSVILY